MNTNMGKDLIMAILELGTIDARTIDAEALTRAYDAYRHDAFDGYLPDAEGVGALASDFVNAAAKTIAAHVGAGEQTSFINEDTAAQDVDALRSSLKTDSFRTPLLTITHETVRSWLAAQFKDADDLLRTALGAYADDMFAAAPRDEQEASINAAQYIQEGPALAAIVNEISEANIEHLSGKDMQSGAFLVYDGTKYGTATDDPNMVLFE